LLYLELYLHGHRTLHRSRRLSDVLAGVRTQSPGAVLAVLFAALDADGGPEETQLPKRPPVCALGRAGFRRPRANRIQECERRRRAAALEGRQSHHACRRTIGWPLLRPLAGEPGLTLQRLAELE
jgi:hypothetical protein